MVAEGTSWVLPIMYDTNPMRSQTVQRFRRIRAISALATR
jgi:hypothetical protein